MKMIPYNNGYRGRQRLMRVTAFDNASDTKTGIVFARAKFDSGTDGQVLTIYNASGTRMELARLTNNQFRFIAANPATTTVLSVSSPVGGVTADGDYHSFLLSFDMTDQTKTRMYVDGVAVTITYTTFTAGEDISYSHTTHGVGATQIAAGTLPMQGKLSFLMIDNTYHNLSDSDVLARFQDSSGDVQDPGYFGQNWMNARPMLLIKGRLKPHINYGYGGDLFINSLANRTDPAEPPNRGITDGRRPVSQVEDLYLLSATGDIEYIAADNSINSTAGAFPLFGINRYIQAYGSTNNDGVFRTHATTVPTASKIVLDSSTLVTNESPAGKVSFHRTGRLIL